MEELLSHLKKKKKGLAFFMIKEKIKKYLLNKITKYTYSIKNPRNEAIKFYWIHEKLNLVSVKSIKRIWIERDLIEDMLNFKLTNWNITNQLT